MCWTATDQFREWLSKLIQRTNVSEAIQMLALNLIMRLTKKTSIAGLPGSEYRIILVALEIANKLLEDNTYTARTWSDVAGIEVAAINFGEREVLRALGWRVLPNASEWSEWKTQVAEYRHKRHEALCGRMLPMPAPSISFDANYSMLSSPHLKLPVGQSRSQPGSPLGAIGEQSASAQNRRKRKADDADLEGHLLEQPPLNVARRSSAGQLQRQPPLYQAALQQGLMRSSSLSPISAFSPFSGSPVSTPYNTPPAVFSPAAYGYLTTRLPSPAMPANPQGLLYHIVLTTDPITGRITTQLVAAPARRASNTPYYPATPQSSLGANSPPPPYDAI